MSNIKDLIRNISSDADDSIISGDRCVNLIAEVTDVDKKLRTLTCKTTTGLELRQIKLQSMPNSKLGIVVYPRKGSSVSLLFNGDTSAGVVVLTEDVESIEVNIGDGTKLEITEDGVSLTVKDGITLEVDDSVAKFNGGDLGGLINIADLTSHLNTIENDINTLKGVFSGWVTVPQDGGAALKAAAATWAGQQLTPSKRGDYEDTKVKH